MLEYNSTGIYLEAENSTKIQGFDSNGNVQNQGLEIGDEIISVNGVNIENNPVQRTLEVFCKNPQLTF